jgi:hypothetical protein
MQQTDCALIDPPFVERRWKQRRALCIVPDWIVEEVAHGLLPHDPANADATTARERSLMEMHLRDVADRLIGQLRMTFDEFGDAAVAGAAQRLYDTRGSGNLELLKIENERANTSAAAAKYRFTGCGLSELEDIDSEAVAALVTTLVWADELAGDYADSRIGANG